MKFNYKHIVLIFISIFSLFISYLVFDSMRKQTVIVNDLVSGRTSFLHDDLGFFFSIIPNVSTTTIPLYNYRAYYLWKENRIDEAFNVYSQSKLKINPHIHFSDYMLAQIFLSQKEYDSALNHANAAFYAWPKKFEHYTILNDILVEKRDTLQILKAYDFVDSIFSDRPKYVNDFISSFASAKIKYLAKYDSISDVNINFLTGKWERVLEYENGSFYKIPDNEISFSKNLFQSQQGSFLFTLKKDSLFIYPPSNPNYLLTKFRIKYSKEYSTMILEGLNTDEKKDFKFFKKITNN